MMVNLVIIFFGKIISKFFRFFNLGDGSTWPGHIALGANKNFINQVLKKSKTKVIIVAGTNGKTTTSSLITHVLKENSKSVIQNKSGANLLNGIASTILLHCNNAGKLHADFAIFEIDENVVPLILKEITPDYLVLLNLFRDQLDRYGEINTIAAKWKDALNVIARDASIKQSQKNKKTIFILNADDPQITFIAENSSAKTKYFGCSDVSIRHNNTDHSADSNHCPKCRNKLTYLEKTFSHLGNWRCNKCGFKRPKLDLNNFPVYPLPGIYNKYNTHAAVLTLQATGLSEINIVNSFRSFLPAFGRQEILTYKNKKVQIFLSKNPTSFNQSFQTISDLGAKTLLLVLNDRIPDGRDVSWIWDTDMPRIGNFKHVLISGDRAFDMALRIYYEDYRNLTTYDDLSRAINAGISLIDDNETFFILPTYSAMLETRKILTGKKIL